MRKRIIILSVCLIAFTLAGCIVGDQMTTITIFPDGSAELVVFRSNLHSTQKGDKAEEEIRKYMASFEDRSGDDFDRVAAADGKLTDVRWIRKEPPLSNLVQAGLPTAASLEEFLSISGADGAQIVRADLHKDGDRRKLVLTITPPEGLSLGPTDPDTRRTARANGISETRIAVKDGTIVKSQGYTVASDKRSALLDLESVNELLTQSPSRFEIYIEWQLDN